MAREFARARTFSCRKIAFNFRRTARRHRPSPLPTAPLLRLLRHGSAEAPARSVSLRFGTPVVKQSKLPEELYAGTPLDVPCCSTAPLLPSAGLAAVRPHGSPCGW